MFGLWTKEKFTLVVVPEWSTKDNHGFSSICTLILRKLTSVINRINFSARKPIWMEGTISGYSYCLKVYHDPSNMGINGGKISKLELWKNDSLVVRYDRGWDKKPSTKELLNLVYELVQETDRKHMTRRVTKCC
jgi:hypothetical protein